MKIVQAKINDIPIIQEIAEKSWWENYPGIISNEQIEYMLNLMYSEKEILSQFEQPNYFYYLVQDEENNKVGIMGIEIDFEPKTTKLHRIYLLKQAKGKGLGKLAISELKRLVKNFDNQRIILAVNKNNPAKKFYESQGFSVYAEGVFDIGEGFVMDDYLMEIILD